MRVKLSYTVDEEDVLAEAAKIINLSGEDLQHVVSLFNDVQAELKGDNDETSVVNINKSIEMLDEFRKALLSIDTRISEVIDIIEGYDLYQRNSNHSGAPEPELASAAPIRDPQPQGGPA